MKYEVSQELIQDILNYLMGEVAELMTHQRIEDIGEETLKRELCVTLAERIIKTKR